MAKDAEGCERLKGRPRTRLFRVRSMPDEVLKFSHARAVDADADRQAAARKRSADLGEQSAAVG
jgi:hypothetical protein